MIKHCCSFMLQFLSVQHLISQTIYYDLSTFKGNIFCELKNRIYIVVENVAFTKYNFYYLFFFYRHFFLVTSFHILVTLKNFPYIQITWPNFCNYLRQKVMNTACRNEIKFANANYTYKMKKEYSLTLSYYFFIYITTGK